MENQSVVKPAVHASKLKLFSFYLIMFGLTIAISLGTLEYGLGRYYRSTENKVSMMTFDPQIGWRLRPGVFGIKPGHSLTKHQVHIDENKLRKGPVIPEKTPGLKRIVVLGDSFTFATASPDEDTFPVLLEGILKASGPHEVVNAGVPGYSTAQEMLLMKDLAGKKITGDVYVLMVFINDILDNLRLGEYGGTEKTPAHPGFELGEDGRPYLTHAPEEKYSPNLVPPAEPSSFVVSVLTNRIRTFLQTSPGLVNALNAVGIQPTLPRMPSLVSGWYEEEIVKSGVPLTKALIREIRDEAERDHAQLLVAMIPSPIQVYPDVYGPVLRRTFPDNPDVRNYFEDPERPQKVVSGICQALEIPFLNLLPVMSQHNSEELFIPADGHFSSGGHAVTAEELAKFIKEHANDSIITHSSALDRN